jgi:acetoin utilization deacetylase AcuC-like enzyme
VLDTALDLIAARNPAGLVVSLGLDTYRLDPICDLGLDAALTEQEVAAAAQPVPRRST